VTEETVRMLMPSLSSLLTSLLRLCACHLGNDDL